MSSVGLLRKQKLGGFWNSKWCFRASEGSYESIKLMSDIKLYER